MQRNLTYGSKTVRVINATAAGTSAVNGSSVDTFGFTGVRFVVGLGTLTATQVTSLKVQGSDDNSTWSDLASTNTGPAADADGNKLLITETYRPKHRYVRPVVVRGTANAVVDFGIAEMFLAQNEPVAADATVSAQKVLDYPDYGTA